MISLYGQGLTTGEICDHLEETYGTSISKDTVSRITDSIVADMEAWQSRPWTRLGFQWSLRIRWSVGVASIFA